MNFIIEFIRNDIGRVLPPGVRCSKEDAINRYKISSAKQTVLTLLHRLRFSYVKKTEEGEIIFQ